MNADRDWLGSRLAGVPATLSERVRAAARDVRSDEPPVERLADAAINALERLIAGGDHSRAVAGDLLAADALVTWACEAGAERWLAEQGDDAALEQWCASFAARIAALARPQG